MVFKFQRALSHSEDLKKHRFLRPTPKASKSKGLTVAQEFAFMTSFQVILMTV